MGILSLTLVGHVCHQSSVLFIVCNWANKMMKTILILTCFAAASLAQDTTEPLPKCDGFTCPNNDPEGGLYEYGDGCSGTFCDCSYGVPYRLECEDANPPLFFDPSQEVCNWCFNMCDKCGHKCPACK